ncbi:MAG: PCRF domain-containing protein, partial [Anaerolineales bacterium]|nr:PCRF domain-containing protein [Anaerolineales bacterium]
MLDKIAGIEARYDEIEKELSEAASNYQRVAELSKERSDLQPLVDKARAYRAALQRQAEAKELAYGK